MNSNEGDKSQIQRQSVLLGNSALPAAVASTPAAQTQQAALQAAVVQPALGVIPPQQSAVQQSAGVAGVNVDRIRQRLDAEHRAQLDEILAQRAPIKAVQRAPAPAPVESKSNVLQVEIERTKEDRDRVLGRYPPADKRTEDEQARYDKLKAHYDALISRMSSAHDKDAGRPQEQVQRPTQQLYQPQPPQQAPQQPQHVLPAPQPKPQSAGAAAVASANANSVVPRATALVAPKAEPVSAQPANTDRPVNPLMEARQFLGFIQEKYRHDSEVYAEFVKSMQDYRRKVLSTLEVVMKFRQLVGADPSILTKFNAFLPEKYRFDDQGNYSEHVKAKMKKRHISDAVMAPAKGHKPDPARAAVVEAALAAPVQQPRPIPDEPNSDFATAESRNNMLRVAKDYIMQVRKKLFAPTMTEGDMLKEQKLYNAFLDVLKQYRQQQIRTLGVVQTIDTLFRGHPDLRHGFLVFLPEDWKQYTIDTYNWPATGDEAQEQVAKQAAKGRKRRKQYVYYAESGSEDLDEEINAARAAASRSSRRRQLAAKTVVVNPPSPVPARERMPHSDWFSYALYTVIEDAMADAFLQYSKENVSDDVMTQLGPLYVFDESGTIVSVHKEGWAACFAEVICNGLLQAKTLQTHMEYFDEHKPAFMALFQPFTATNVLEQYDMTPTTMFDELSILFTNTDLVDPRLMVGRSTALKARGSLAIKLQQYLDARSQAPDAEGQEEADTADYALYHPIGLYGASVDALLRLSNDTGRHLAPFDARIRELTVSRPVEPDPFATLLRLIPHDMVTRSGVYKAKKPHRQTVIDRLRTWQRHDRSYVKQPDSERAPVSTGMDSVGESVLNTTYRTIPYYAFDELDKTDKKAKAAAEFDEEAASRHSASNVCVTNAACDDLALLEDERLVHDIHIKRTEIVLDKLKAYQRVRPTTPGILGDVDIHHLSFIYGPSAPELMELIRTRPDKVVPVLVSRLEAKLEVMRSQVDDLMGTWYRRAAIAWPRSCDLEGNRFRYRDRRTLNARTLLLDLLFRTEHTAADSDKEVRHDWLAQSNYVTHLMSVQGKELDEWSTFDICTHLDDLAPTRPVSLRWPDLSVASTLRSMPTEEEVAASGFTISIEGARKVRRLLRDDLGQFLGLDQETVSSGLVDGNDARTAAAPKTSRAYRALFTVAEQAQSAPNSPEPRPRTRVSVGHESEPDKAMVVTRLTRSQAKGDDVDVAFTLEDADTILKTRPRRARRTAPEKRAHLEEEESQEDEREEEPEAKAHSDAEAPTAHSVATTEAFNLHAVVKALQVNSTPGTLPALALNTPSADAVRAAVHCVITTASSNNKAPCQYVCAAVGNRLLAPDAEDVTMVVSAPLYAMIRMVWALASRFDLVVDAAASNSRDRFKGPSA
ncbi:Paired amphipathic helix repeat [Carpediemonas membranifera]|uniref:Paired amphipathic helix repeat n=1 Tax=Carpediemonas membranifera TaxID=201153 RepID=A0A8J6DZJ8_9EUKA|nr:Paired amphipathic helix repeat [Carpediemonas membranifera]|eukprot:KAG9390818.1 Paired amphipathic helix repeat [Carpediemonas membranifera]